jgi:hypothetical protein
MRDRGELGVAAVCCLLHSLATGGSTWQWIRLLERHVGLGGRATIFAAPGPLAERALAAGIAVVPTSWEETATPGGLWSAVGEHEVAVVQCEQGVQDAFPRALAACGRAVLALHQAPQTVTRRLAPPTPARVRRTVKRAAADPHALVLVRGKAHRRKVAAAYGLPREALWILPPSVALPELPAAPPRGEPERVLAMTRLAPEKAAIPRVAVELVRERLAAGRSCELAIAGDGPLKPEAVSLCEQGLPPGSWRIEAAPENPIERLAAADVVVAQGLTTLEAAALGRRVVVARSLGARGASGAVLTPDVYDEAARDPFGDPRVTEDAVRLWDELLAVDEQALNTLRHLVENHNSLPAASRALGEALSATGT